MRGRELFGVALRVLGFWCLIQAGATGIHIVSLSLHQEMGNSQFLVEEYKFNIAYYVSIALVLIGLAKPIVRLVYGSEE